ncbi:hypothetical protein B0T16DRAFT_229802 [Cercophora newfieldiana]|uniref:Uncharacterized protein n=1 Tax=Cercophora newfieldiana TaxID=92897 RepID=A0AA39XR73_9PEZI|nr:hypothetical protein B0T16DRAFT_229802 [Cercophora newfieldiana]
MTLPPPAGTKHRSSGSPSPETPSLFPLPIGPMPTSRMQRGILCTAIGRPSRPFLLIVCDTERKRKTGYVLSGHGMETTRKGFRDGNLYWRWVSGADLRRGRFGVVGIAVGALLTGAGWEC